VRREGDALLFSGALVRDAVADTWKQALPLRDGARRLDLTAATRVDSAGLALLAELAARMDGATIEGEPEGLGELCAAYRLSPTLAYATEQAVG
jgi:phospholipid transport system transporter-binding protein